MLSAMKWCEQRSVCDAECRLLPCSTVLIGLQAATTHATARTPLVLVPSSQRLCVGPREPQCHDEPCYCCFAIQVPGASSDSGVRSTWQLAQASLERCDAVFEEHNDYDNRFCHLRVGVCWCNLRVFPSRHFNPHEAWRVWKRGHASFVFQTQLRLPHTWGSVFGVPDPPRPTVARGVSSGGGAVAGTSRAGGGRGCLEALSERECSLVRNEAACRTAARCRWQNQREVPCAPRCARCSAATCLSVLAKPGRATQKGANAPLSACRDAHSSGAPQGRSSRAGAWDLADPLGAAAAPGRERTLVLVVQERADMTAAPARAAPAPRGTARRPEARARFRAVGRGGTARPVPVRGSSQTFLGRARAAQQRRARHPAGPAARPGATSRGT